MILKRTTLLIAILAIVFSGCTKRYYDSNNPYTPPYHIDGINDLTLMKSSFPAQTAMFLNVSYMNSRQERLTLSFENVPQGLHYEISNPTGYPSFSSQVIFTDSNTAIGTYTVKLVAKGDSSGRNVYPFTITVLPVPDCTADWTGNFLSTNGCISGGSFTESVTASSAISNRIFVNNFENSGQTLFVDLDCSSQSLSIPTQTIGGFSITGNGEFFMSGSTQFLNLRYFKSPIGGGGGFSCQESLRR